MATNRIDGQWTRKVSLTVQELEYFVNNLSKISGDGLISNEDEDDYGFCPSKCLTAVMTQVG
ncbi:hypothetical protein NQ314_013905 [Rhamnusium bicolor]|uniref:Uncharacterized protein n=1 Tax=Rhamnusium bicolor TaxID=1586634 RepID=A0AAV8X4B8_9CUCU|nr:hypothetical protein NQ314_013905 [Rhamnusium bicolor]